MAQDKRENQIKGSLPHTYKFLKTGKPSYLRSLLSFHSLHIVLLGLLLPSPLVALLSPLVLKYQIDLIIILLLLYGTISHLIKVTLLITSLFIQYSPVSDLSTSLFLKKLKS